MCKNLLRSYGHKRNNSKAKFSSHLNCRQKNVSETGPSSILISRTITQMAPNEIVYSNNSVQKMKSRALNSNRINWVTEHTPAMNIKMSLRNALAFYSKINISLKIPNARVALDSHCFQTRLYVEIYVDFISSNMTKMRQWLFPCKIHIFLTSIFNLTEGFIHNRICVPWLFREKIVAFSCIELINMSLFGNHETWPVAFKITLHRYIRNYTPLCITNL